MKAYQCDICGRYYKSSSSKTKATNPITGDELGFVPSTIIFGNGGSATTAPKDICQDCVDRFRKLVYSTREESGYNP